MSAEEIAEKYLNEKLKELGTNIPQYKHLVINLMVRYAKEMCEIQKQQCLIEAETYDNGEIIDYSILNAKNVAE
jgi:hypothetical protein